MDRLEFYAKVPDGGPWFLLATETWLLIAAVVVLSATILLVTCLSARQSSVAGRLMAAIFPRRADNLFMRVNIQQTDQSSQAYLASLGSHTMRLYSKCRLDAGAIIRITPPGVQVVVQEIRQISAEPPWFSIEAEPVFRDDVTKRNYRKFLGELSQVA